MRGGIRREAKIAHPRRHVAIAAFDASGEGVGVEVRLQSIDAGDRHGAIGRDVLPAIGGGGDDVGRSCGVAYESASLEKVGSSASQSIGDRKIGSAAGECEAGDGARRQQIIGASGDAEYAAGCRIRSQSRVALGGLRTAKTGRPHAPAWVVSVADRRLAVDRGVGVTLASGKRLIRRSIDAQAKALLREKRRACAGIEAATRRVGIAHYPHELCHRVERGLLRSNSALAGNLGQPGGRQTAEHQRNAAGAVEEIDQRVADALLIAVQAAAGRRDEIQREIQIGIVGIVAQARLEA